MEHNHTPGNVINPGNDFKTGSKEEVALNINFF